jgi:predicted nucleotidyltransferase
MVRSETDKNVKDEISNQAVNLDFLEESTGFPKEFIKKELLLDEKNLDLDQLRLKMLNYLERVNLEQSGVQA